MSSQTITRNKSNGVFLCVVNSHCQRQCQFSRLKSHLIFRYLSTVVFCAFVTEVRCLGGHPHAFSSHCISNPQKTPNFSVCGGTNHKQFLQYTSLRRQIYYSYATRSEILVRSVNIIKARTSHSFLLHAEIYTFSSLMILKRNRVKTSQFVLFQIYYELSYYCVNFVKLEHSEETFSIFTQTIRIKCSV